MLEKFPHAPTTEALIDIRTELPSGISIQDIDKTHPLFQSDYPKKKARWQSESVFEIKEGTLQKTSNDDPRIDGYLFWSADEKQVVQFRLNGFTFSRLKPYKQWEHMFPEAIRLWRTYEQNLKPTAITRLAVRYINSIEIPSNKANLQDYLSAAPVIPGNLPQAVQQFLSQVIVEFKEEQCRAIITQTIVPKGTPTITPVILDIDIVRDLRLTPEEGAIKQVLSDLHGVADRIFDESITEKTKELFR
jgi:uncharacterized protein (TIGR04255 family)